MARIGLEIVRALIEHIGDDPTRSGLKDTPSRVVKSWEELFKGYQFEINPDNEAELLKTFPDVTSDEMIVVNDIPFISFCEHHLLPFTGTAKFGYLPDKHIVGLSKIPRLVDMKASKLQVQERLTTEIVDTFNDIVKPKGCGCVITATHMCCTARGIKAVGTTMVTSALRGVFKTSETSKREFLGL